MLITTHAGGVVYRRRRETIEFLLVKSKDRTSRVTPKGHIEPGERAVDAAVREVREEAGYDLTPGPCLGTFTHRVRGGQVTTAYFLMEADPAEPPGRLDEPFRDPRWFTLDGLKRPDLPVPDGVRDLLAEAHRALDAGPDA